MPRLSPLILLALAFLMLGPAAAPAQTGMPDDCRRWFDGCNTCSRGPSGQILCTQRKCAKVTASICLEPIRERQMIPTDCAVWFDGCNTCRRRGGRTVICTRRYCGAKNAPARCVRKIGEER